MESTSVKERATGLALARDRTRMPGLAVSIALGLAVLVLGVYFFRLSAQNAIGADQAGYLLYAHDAIQGNWVLRGWTFPEDPYWLPDGLLYAVGAAVRGIDPVLLYAVPTAVCIALAAAMVTAATVATAPRTAWPFVAGVAILPVLFPSPDLAAVILMGPFHTGTVVFALASMLSLYLAQQPGQGRGRRWILSGVAFLLLTSARLGDPYITIVAVVPIILVSGARLLLEHPASARSRHLIPVSVAVASWPGFLALLWLLRHLGGATVTPFHPTTIAYARLGDSVAALGLALLKVVGGDIFGRVFDASLIPAVLRLTYLASALVVAWLVLRDEVRAAAHGRPGQDWLLAVTAVAAAVALAGNILGTSDVDTRYRVPPFIMLSVALARWLGIRAGSWIAHRTIPAAAIGALFVYLYVGPIASYASPPTVGGRVLPTASMNGSDSDLALGRWLARRGLVCGYAGYPEASIVTVVTHGAVKVRPVASTKVNQPGLGPSHLPANEWRISPYRWLSRDAWYAADPGAKFLVLNPAPSWDRDVGVDVDTAVNTFGPPSHIYRHVGRYTVLVWDAPIHL